MTKLGKEGDQGRYTGNTSFTIVTMMYAAVYLFQMDFSAIAITNFWPSSNGQLKYLSCYKERLETA